MYNTQEGMIKLINKKLKNLLLFTLLIFVHSLTFAQVYEYDYQNDLTDEYEEVSNEEQNNSQETTEVQEETPIEKEIFKDNKKYKTQIIDSNDATFISRTNSYHAFFTSLGTTILTDYFTAGLKLSAEYNYGFKNTPIYTGFGINGTLNFPQFNYPYTYKIEGDKTTSPSLLGFSFYVPCGIFIKLGDTDCFLNASAKLGMKYYSLMIFSLKGIYAGSINPTFYFNANAGILYKFIGISFEMEFDSICKFYPGVSVYAQIVKRK